MRIAIVEDDVQVRHQLSAYISRYYHGDMSLFTIFEFDDGDQILENYSAMYDLILLDIQMARCDGIQAAHQIREMDRDVLLVFVTNLAQYAIQGYAVQAYDFILKPVNAVMLHTLLERVEKLLSERDTKYISLPTEKGMMRIRVSDINYVETIKHVSIIHAQTGDYSLRKSMKVMEEMFNQYHFFRCNNCYLVNLQKVEQVNMNEATVAGNVLTISRPRYKAFMEALTQYIGGT